MTTWVLTVVVVLGGSASAQLLQPLDHYISIQPNAGIDAIGGSPSIAFDGTNFLAVYRDRRAEATNGFDIYATRIATDGTVLDPDGIPIAIGPNYDFAPGNQYIPSVTFDGTNYFVVWVENRNPLTVDYQIYAAHVTPAGQVVESGGIQLTVGASPQRMPSIAFDGTNYLIVWRSSATIYGLQVAKNGTPIGNRAGFVIGGPGFYPYVAFDGTNYFVVWHDQRNGNLDIYGARVSTAGVVIDTNGIPICTDPADQDHSTVTFNGTNYVVAWWDGRGVHDSSNTGSAYAARVTRDGVVLDPDGVRVGDFARNQPPVVSASDGANVMIAWQQDLAFADYRSTDTFGRRMKPDGTFLDPAPLDLGASYGNQFGPTIAFGGGRYIVAWNDGLADSRCFTGCPYAQMFTLTSNVIPQATGTTATNTVGQWEALPGPGQAPLSTISVTSDRNLFVAGEGFAARWDGASWSSQSIGARHYGSWAYSASDVWAVGWCGLFLHYDGTSWSTRHCTAMPIGMALWPLGSGDLLAVGTGGSSILYQTSTDSQQGLATSTTYDLRDLWGTSANNVYAVGEFGTVLHWDGTAWSKVAGIPTLQSLNGIWGSGANDIFAVGDSGTVVHYDGTCWALQKSGTTEHLMAVAASRHVYAVGLHGTVLRYDGGIWNVENSGTSMSLYDIAAIGDTVWAAGSGTTVLTKTDPLLGYADGDVNGDGVVAVGDVFHIINYLFGSAAVPVGSADVNGDGKINAADVFYLLGYLFAGGPAPLPSPPARIANTCG